MSHIQSKNTNPEIRVRKELFRQGYRYRLNVTKLPGKPDIVLPRYKTAIFINGCFWHGHEGCRYFVLPKTNADFWKLKIRSNQQRDKAESEALKSMGWKVLAIWECELKKDRFKETIENLVSGLQESYKKQE